MIGLKRFTIFATVALASAVAFATPATQESVQVVSPRWEVGKVSFENTLFSVPQARAEATVAKYTYESLNRQLSRMTDNLRNDFRESEKFVQATDKFNAAYAKLEAARERAVKDLKQSDQYQASLSLKNRVTAQIAEEVAKDPKNLDVDRLSALASLKLDFMSQVRVLEQDAIAASTEVVDAREKLQTAGVELASLERQFEKTIRDNVELIDLRKSCEEAKISYLASSAYLSELRTVSSISYDFAVKSRILDRYTPRFGFRERYYR